MLNDRNNNNNKKPTPKQKFIQVNMTMLIGHQRDYYYNNKTTIQQCVCIIICFCLKIQHSYNTVNIIFKT